MPRLPNTPRNPRAGAKEMFIKGNKLQPLAIGLIALLAGAGVVVILDGLDNTWGNLFTTQYTGYGLPGEEPVYSIEVWDGVEGIQLDTSDFNYTLWGTDNLDDWVDFEEIEDGNDLDDITEADLTDEDNDYLFFVVNYSGYVEEESMDEWENDYLGDRTYSERWSVLNINAKNMLLSYQKPSDSGIALLNSETFEALNYSMELNTTTNFTIVASSNVSQPSAKYVTGYNYQDEMDLTPRIIMTFNGSVNSGDISISGTTKDRVNDTALEFSFYELSATPQFFIAEWNPDETALAITHVELYYGEELLLTVF